jgi:uncharacterized protein
VTPSSRPAGSANGERRAEFLATCAAAVRWAEMCPEVVALGLAGSWARGAARMDSDADLVVVTAAVSRFVEREDWVQDAIGQPAAVVRSQHWGALTERRVRLASGFEVEFGFVGRAWAEEPVDEGTARVVADGFQVLYDPEGLLAHLVGAVSAAQGVVRR